MSKFIVQAEAAGDVLYSDEGLSFWGGVDPSRDGLSMFTIHGMALK
jgi:predicted aconitase with swiveling domain